MIDLPSVCIMIPTFNQASYVVNAVKSALAQDYPNVEIVIADDCSTDNTQEILIPFISHPKITYIKNAVNIGRVANYKKCLFEYCSAKWVINLDGDDYYTNPSFISSAIEAIKNRGKEKVLFYLGSHFRKNEHQEKLQTPRIQHNELVISSTDYFFGYFKYRHFSHMSILYNRKLALESSFYEKNILSTDIQSMLQFCLTYPDSLVILSKNISGIWLHHNSNQSNTININKHWENFMIFKNLYRQAIEKGFNKLRCLGWLMKASVIYLRTYVGILTRTIS